jgi:hypothetical protein
MAKIDPLKDGLTITAYWGPRPETPVQIAARCQILLDCLAAISPVFSGWTYVGRRTQAVRPQNGVQDTPEERYRDSYHTVALDRPSEADLVPLIQAGVCRDDDDAPDAMMGYRFSAYIRSRTDPDGVSLRVHAGCRWPGRFLINTVHIETRPLCEENQSWLTLPLLEAAMPATVTAWDVTWAAIYPTELMELWAPAYTKPRSNPQSGLDDVFIAAFRAVGDAAALSNCRTHAARRHRDDRDQRSL